MSGALRYPGGRGCLEGCGPRQNLPAPCPGSDTTFQVWVVLPSNPATGIMNPTLKMKKQRLREVKGLSQTFYLLDNHLLLTLACSCYSLFAGLDLSEDSNRHPVRRTETGWVGELGPCPFRCLLPWPAPFSPADLNVGRRPGEVTSRGPCDSVICCVLPEVQARCHPSGQQ